jgi:hypothetical protein
MFGFKTFLTAEQTLKGIKAMLMIRVAWFNKIFYESMVLLHNVV